jgi:hypothetical protein
VDGSAELSVMHTSSNRTHFHMGMSMVMQMVHHLYQQCSARAGLPESLLLDGAQQTSILSTCFEVMFTEHCYRKAAAVMGCHLPYLGGL